MIASNPLRRALRHVRVVGALAAGLGELAKLQGWRLRARFLPKAR